VAKVEMKNHYVVARKVFACTAFFSVLMTAKRASGKQSPVDFWYFLAF
jgi:hypothetical protein